MKRLALILILLTLSACTLSTPADTPTPVPVQAPAQLQVPVVGLQPVSGAPGTVIKIGVAGFPAGTRVGLNLSSSSSNTVQAAQDLPIDQSGDLIFSLTLPSQVGSDTLNRTLPLTFTIVTTNQQVRADAIFLVTAGTGTLSVSPTSASTTGNPSGGQLANTLFITAPAIGSLQTGAITVTGSGSAFNNVVAVQVWDAHSQPINGANATIQAVAGAIGPWQTTITYPQPSVTSVGYVVAFTYNKNGTLAQQASINVVLAAANLPTVVPSVVPTAVPPPIFITATPTPG